MRGSDRHESSLSEDVTSFKSGIYGADDMPKLTGSLNCKIVTFPFGVLLKKVRNEYEEIFSFVM